MTNTSFWESRRDIGIKRVPSNSTSGSARSDEVPQGDAVLRIEKMIFSNLAQKKTSYFFQKICRNYYRCTYKKGVCDCFKAIRIRQMLLHAVPEVIFRELEDIEGQELVAIEESRDKVILFFGFEKADKEARPIAFKIDVLKTARKNVFKCGRSCVNEDTRVLFARRKLDWQTTGFLRLSAGTN